jgi:hypothetical protein
MFFAMEERRSRLKDGTVNPFVDPAGLQRYVQQSERQFPPKERSRSSVLEAARSQGSRAREPRRGMVS